MLTGVIFVGMSDALTNWLAQKTRSRDPFVIKFVFSIWNPFSPSIVTYNAAFD